MSEYFGLNMSTPIEDLYPFPDEINDDHKVYTVTAISIALGVITSVIVLIRLGIRFAYKSLGADDYAIVPAVVKFSFHSA